MSDEAIKAIVAGTTIIFIVACVTAYQMWDVWCNRPNRK